MLPLFLQGMLMSHGDYKWSCKVIFCNGDVFVYQLQSVLCTHTILCLGVLCTVKLHRFTFGRLLHCIVHYFACGRFVQIKFVRSFIDAQKLPCYSCLWRFCCVFMSYRCTFTSC